MPVADVPHPTYLQLHTDHVLLLQLSVLLWFDFAGIAIQPETDRLVVGRINIIMVEYLIVKQIHGENSFHMK